MLNARCMRRSSRVTRFTVALTALLALGVGSAREAQAQVSPLPLDFPDVVIFATNSARLQNDAHVVAGHVVVNHASPGPTLRAGVELGVGQHALTPAGFSLAADTIIIDQDAVVGGNVFYNDLVNQGTIHGTLSTPLPPFPLFTPLPVFQSAPAGTQDITVARYNVRTLAPGDYRDINVHMDATLNLGPGIYNVRSINTEFHSEILFQNLSADTSEVRVANELTTGSNGFVGPDPADPTQASQIIFMSPSPHRQAR